MQSEGETSFLDRCLQSIQESGFSFKTVTPKEWIEKLRSSTKDVKVNPTVKLLDYYEKLYFTEGSLTGATYRTEQAVALSPTLKHCQTFIQTGLMYKMLKQWMAEWN
jgi:hypothetical protein